MGLLFASHGSVIAGKYRLEERIGGGGMGEVFRALEIATGQRVAVKLLHPELAQNDDLYQRFVQEAEAANSIRHPNVVDIIEAGRSEYGPYIAMEHLEGESVGAALRRVGRFDGDAAIATLAPVLEALDAAHRIGIIHRDLKPENVFFARQHGGSVPVVRLLDFGIAKMLDPVGPTPHTRTGVVFGTPDYLSPEQATGETPLDGRSDLFAVGVLFYELLSGVRPFRAATAVATAFRVVHSEAATLAGSGVEVDPRLDEVVRRLLQKNPSKRYAHALEVVEALEAIVTPSRWGSALGALATRVGAPESRSAPTVATPIRSAAEGSRDATPRGFPERLRARFHARGPVLRAVDEALGQRFGVEGRRRVVAALDARWLDDFRGESVNGLISYPLEEVDAYLVAATELLLHDVELWRTVGRLAVEGSLGSLLKSVVRREPDPAAFARRGILVWSRLFEFGEWGFVVREDGGLEVTVADFEPTSRGLRLWLVGIIEQSARRATGTEIVCSITEGEASYRPRLVCELAWPKDRVSAG